MTNRYSANDTVELTIAEEVHPAVFPTVVRSEGPATQEGDLGTFVSRWLEEAARAGSQLQASRPSQVVVVSSAPAPRPRFYRD